MRRFERAQGAFGLLLVAVVATVACQKIQMALPGYQGEPIFEGDRFSVQVTKTQSRCEVDPAEVTYKSRQGTSQVLSLVEAVSVKDTVAAKVVIPARESGCGTGEFVILNKEIARQAKYMYARRPRADNWPLR
jgi:hypothetical protein